MFNEIKEKSAIENCFIQFPYFNHKLYDIPSNIQEEEETLSKSNYDNQSLEDSSTCVSNSNERKDSTDNEEKFIPLNLFDFSPIKTSNFPEEKQTEQMPKPIKLFVFNDSEEKINSNENKPQEIKPELQKYILPKSLFDTTKSKKVEINKNLKFKYTATQVFNQSSASIAK